MLKCVKCTLQRTLIQKVVSRTFRTSSYLKTSNPPNIEKPPEKESLRTILKIQKEVPDIPSDYKAVFKFPLIRQFALINRLKIYQIAFTGIFTPAAMVLNLLDVISVDALKLITVLGISGCMTLYGLGYATQNFIGFIYYNEKTNTARIAYTDNWGRRKDIEVPVEDIVPLDDLPVTLMSKINIVPWMTFRRYSTKDKLKINFQHAIILDKESLKKVM